MVKDFFVNFPTFVAQVQAIEGSPIEFYMSEWVLSLYKTEASIPNRFFMPYPYIHTYLEHIYNWNSQREGIRDQYMEWFEKCYHKMKETKNYDDYAKVPIPLFYDLNTQPTWDQFFNYRVKPFIDSSISQEEYEEYGDALVWIGLDRNSCAIVPNKYNPMKDEKGIISSITSPDNPDDIRVSMFVPSSEKIWIKDFPSNQYVNLGDSDYTLQYPEILEAMKQTTGNIYLFDGENIE